MVSNNILASRRAIIAVRFHNEITSPVTYQVNSVLEAAWLQDEAWRNRMGYGLWACGQAVSVHRTSNVEHTHTIVFQHIRTRRFEGKRNLPEIDWERAASDLRRVFNCSGKNTCIVLACRTERPLTFNCLRRHSTARL